MRKGAIFFGAMLYGTSWIVGLVNLAAASFAAIEGRSPAGYVPMILMSFGLILFIHRINGWFPFQRPG